MDNVGSRNTIGGNDNLYDGPLQKRANLNNIAINKAVLQQINPLRYQKQYYRLIC